MIQVGGTYQQMNGNTKIRLVRVIALDGDNATVVALFGPLAGEQYAVHVRQLSAGPLAQQPGR